MSCISLWFHITAVGSPFLWFHRNTLSRVFIFLNICQECRKQSFYRLDTTTAERHKPTVSIAIISNLFENLLFIIKIKMAKFIDRTGGNTWSSGPAPPPPPGTPPVTKGNRDHKSGGHSTSSGAGTSDGGKKSGIGGGGIAGIIISILVVGAIIAFFLVKRRSKKSISDVEKLDNQPLAPLTSNEVHGQHLAYYRNIIFIFYDNIFLIFIYL